MSRFAVWVVAYGAALWVVGRSSSGAPGLLWLVFWIAAIVAGVYYLIRLVSVFKDRVLWRLRRRLIVAYAFIAVVPILLILVLVGLGVVMVNGQFAAFLVTLRLRDQLEDLRQINRVVAHEAHMTRAGNPKDLLDHLQLFYSQELEQHAASYPGLDVTLRLGSEMRAFQLNGTALAKPVSLPAWMKSEEFKNSVIDNGRISLRAVDEEDTPAGRLTLVLTEPFDSELLDLVGEGIGPVGIVIPASGGSATPASTDLSSLPLSGPGLEYQRAALRSKSVALPRPTNLLDVSVFGVSTLDPVEWDAAGEQHLPQPVLVLVTSRLWTLNRQLLATLGRYSRVYVTIFLIVGAFFLAIELIALILGIRLTSSITTTVDNLYDATERVRKGDLAYRISLPSRDQLSALGAAFDTMTASVQQLLRESQEKLRLENELEIAHEVQNQLFPQSIPDVPGLQLYGTCIPARGVSGDYYDFLKAGRGVGIVLGDVSGKGISSALLMAAIQSAIRAQLYGLATGDKGLPPAMRSTAEVVRRLNRQLYETTPAEKYATFFYAVYDTASRKLTYTNAGHPPPILFRGSRTERLRIGGTAVGLFDEVPYEEGEIYLEPGDLLLAFTDGITEPENNYEEEFGEDRVTKVVLRSLDSSPGDLAEEICRAVNDWTGSPELQDDMTLIVARASG